MVVDGEREMLQQHGQEEDIKSARASSEGKRQMANQPAAVPRNTLIAEHIYRRRRKQRHELAVHDQADFSLCQTWATPQPPI